MRRLRKGAHQPGNGSWIGKAARLCIYLRDGFQCVYCGKDLHAEKPFNITLDHLRCRQDGGTDEPRNMVTACRSCNSGRGVKAWHSYAPAGAVERIERNRRRSVTRHLTLARAILAGTARNLKVEGKR